jgi:serine/threonine protein kinase
MPTAAVLALAAGLAEGLAAIHSSGVVHRDLKPANVLLAEDGPRLIDFGISRSLEAISLTRTGIVVGSPGFMSPEQAAGREVGPPSDIFSLGAVLTFAATGQGPFGDGSTPALLYRVVSTQPNTSGLPGEIRPALERCLAKDPRSRPTAAQLLTELSTALPVALPRPEPGIGGFPGLGPPAPVPGGADHVAALPTHLATERAAPARPGDGTPAWGPTVSALQPHVAGPTLPRITSSPLPPVTVPPLPPGYDRRVAEARRHRPFRPGWLIAVAAAVVLVAGAGAFLATRFGHVSDRARNASASSSAVNPTSPVTSATHLVPPR